MRPLVLGREGPICSLGNLAIRKRSGAKQHILDWCHLWKSSTPPGIYGCHFYPPQKSFQSRSFHHHHHHHHRLLWVPFRWDGGWDFCYLPKSRGYLLNDVTIHRSPPRCGSNAKLQGFGVGFFLTIGIRQTWRNWWEKKGKRETLYMLCDVVCIFVFWRGIWRMVMNPSHPEKEKIRRLISPHEWCGDSCFPNLFKLKHSGKLT